MFDYRKWLDAFIAGGSPSADTLRHYTAEIENYLAWCEGNAYNPLEIDEIDARLYVRYLVERKYSPASIAIKTAAARCYYNIAMRLKETTANPFEGVKSKAPSYDDTDFAYLKKDEIAEMCGKLQQENTLYSLRTLAMVMLMAVEGLRTVEVHRMSDEDINFQRGVIFIHGKRKDEFIYPCKDTLIILQQYLSLRTKALRDENGTPTFINLSRTSLGGRVSRNGIRMAINKALESVGRKEQGVSCHALRHSCGTNLYAETKDLRIVQETLRQKSPVVTARYAHVSERINDRTTGRISPFQRDDNG